MAQKGSRSWKLERASVTGRGKSRPQSNKYSGSDKGKEPPGGSRQRVWVGGYKRSDGTRVNGYYRSV